MREDGPVMMSSRGYQSIPMPDAYLSHGQCTSQGSGGHRTASNTLLTRLLNAHPRGVPAENKVAAVSRPDGFTRSCRGIQPRTCELMFTSRRKSVSSLSGTTG